MVKPPSEIGYGKSSNVFYREESGEIPKQMRYRDCRKASVGNSSFIDRYDPTQSGSDHKSSTATLELLSKAFFGFDGSSFFVSVFKADYAFELKSDKNQKLEVSNGNQKNNC